MPASGLPAHASLRVHVRTVPAELRPRHSRLCYSFALRRFSLPLHCIPKPTPIKSLTSHAFALPRFALPSPGPAPQSNAFAARISPSPLHAAALLRHNGAVRHLAIASRCATRLCRRHSIRSLSQLGCSTPLRIGSLPVLHGAVRCFAPPLPCLALLRLSFAALGLAGLLRRRAARRHALHFRRLPEQIKALPLQCHSSHFHRVARQSHANPLPPTSSRCRRISLKASLRCSVALHRNAPLSHRYSGSEPSVHSKRPLPLLRHWPRPRSLP